MPYPFSSPPENKKEFIQNLAKGLVQNYGKKKFYSPAEVVSINEEINPDNASELKWWGMSIFCSHDDFEHYLDTVEDEINATDNIYDNLKAEMLLEFTPVAISDWQDIPKIDYDISWLDFGELAGEIFEGLGIYCWNF